MNFYRGETVTILRKTTVGYDERKLPIKSVREEVLQDIIVEFNSSDTERNLLEQAVSTKVTIYFPANTKINEDDQFIIRGSKWVKNGIAADYAPNMTNFLRAIKGAGVVVTVEQYRGNA